MTQARSKAKIRVKTQVQPEKGVGTKTEPNTQTRLPKTIDEYLSSLRVDQRAALSSLREVIRAVAPKAEECMSYRLPTFRLDGRMLVAFGAAARHCALYPLSSRTVAAHRDALKGYETSKGTIRFQPDRPLPASLVRRLVKARIAENRT